MVFLLGSLLIVTIALTLLYAQRLPTTHEKGESIHARIITLDDFLKDLHRDVDRAAYIAGFRALIGLEQQINQRGGFLAEPEPLFIEAFLNGTVNGSALDVLANSTFSDYLAKVNAEASLIGVALNISVADLSLTQSTPWSVDVVFTMAVNLSDTRGLARWDYERVFVTEVPILDLRDPVYSVHTLGKVPNTFRVSPYNDSHFVIGENDTSALYDEAVKMYYREDPSAPSFLQRLAGNLSGRSKYGVASLVNLGDLNAQGFAVRTYLSVVDYYYFSNTTTTNYCPGKGSPLPSWQIRIDEEHYLDPARDYGFQELNATIC